MSFEHVKSGAESLGDNTYVWYPKKIEVEHPWKKGVKHCMKI